jgi:hypothetical protein
VVETTQYAFDLREVAASLLEKQGITSGKWMLAFEFTATIGAFGTTPQDTKPGAMLQVNRVQLLKVPDDVTGNPLVVDASTLSVSLAQKSTSPRSAGKTAPSGKPKRAEL